MKKIFTLVCLLSLICGTAFGGIIEMKGEAGGVRSAYAFNDKSIVANTIAWSDPIDISVLKFDDTSNNNKATISLFVALANTSTAAQNGDLTLTYQLSFDGSGWFSPPPADAANAQYRPNQGWLGQGIWGLTNATGFDGTDSNPTTSTWVAATTAGTAGPYCLTLTGMTVTSISHAKYIRWGAVQPVASRSLVFDLIMSGQGI